MKDRSLIVLWISLELSVKPVTVRAWISKGFLPPITTTIPSKELCDWVEKRKEKKRADSVRHAYRRELTCRS